MEAGDLLGAFHVMHLRAALFGDSFPRQAALGAERIQMEYSERLSAQDTSFLVFEDSNSSAHMHVGGVSIYEGGGLARSRGGVDIEAIRSYIESRLHMLPRYRQRLAYTPIEGEPVWVDDDRFNVRYHVRHTRLPRPGDVRDLKRLAGQIMSQRLDRSRPLWEYWVVEGLQDGRFAALIKTHHCMIDGVSGVDLSAVLMQMEPTSTFEPPPPWQPRPAPDDLSLMKKELGHRLSVPFDIARRARDLVSSTSWATEGLQKNLGSVGKMLGLAWRGAANTPINQTIGPHRRFDWTRVALDEARAIKESLGGTINDVVLATVAGAVGEFLRHRRVNVDILDFIAAIPVNVRAAGDHSLGNQVSAWLARLPIAENDAARRLEQTRAVTSELKRTGGTNAAAYLFQLAEWGGPLALDFVTQLTRRLSPCNMVITNVPGPPFPLYVLEAKMLEAYPLVTLLEGQGIGVAAFSYCGQLHFGFNADWDLLPDLHFFVTAVERAFAELYQAAVPGEASAIATRGAAPSSESPADASSNNLFPVE